MFRNEFLRSAPSKVYGVSPSNVSRIAEALGLTRQALYRRLEKFGLDVG
ncbi:MAG: helix-turn-helix domain-containing protein [Candidatus Kapaibacteriota bacterium]